MKRLAVMAAVVLLSTGANAEDLSEVEVALGEEISTCWNLLPSEVREKPEVLLRFTMLPGGKVERDVEVLEKPYGGDGATIARTAQRAVQSCEPYRTDITEPTEYTVRLKVSE